MEKGLLFQPDFLIIGRDRAICKRLGNLLMGMDFRFQTSYSIHEAYEWLALGYFNVVLIDMPESAGNARRLFDHIYKQYPEIHIMVLLEASNAPWCEDLIKSYSCDILRRTFIDIEFTKSVKHMVHRTALEMDYTRLKEEKTKLEAQLQQARKMGVLGSTAGSVIHDFNNLLGVIMANTDLALEEAQEGSTAYPRLEEVMGASMRAKDILKRVLSYYRCKAGDMEMEAPAHRSISQ